MAKTTKQVFTTPPELRNPTGKGGFGDNPQNRSDGGWKKEEAVSYQYNMLMRLTVDGFNAWLVDNPPEKRTVAQDMAYNAVIKARKSDLGFLKEITDRTEGKPMQKSIMAFENPDVLLDEIERTNYDKFSYKAKGQMVENDEPLQDKG